jgi:hypothetical protein
VGNDVRAGVGALQISGNVSGDVRADVGEASEQTPTMVYPPPGVPRVLSPGLRVLEGATIGGRLVYTSGDEQDGAIESRPGGGVVYQTPVPGQRGGRRRPDPRAEGFTVRAILLAIGRWILARVREFITLLVLGGLALWLVPGLYARTAHFLGVKPWPSLGWGFVTWVAGFVVAAVVAVVLIVVGVIVGLITLGGLAGVIFGLGFSALGLAFALFMFLVRYGSKLVVALLLGRLLLEALMPHRGAAKGEEWTEEAALALDGRQIVWPLVVGTILYVTLHAIPILGWLVALAATLFGLGAIALRATEWWRPRHEGSQL